METLACSETYFFYSENEQFVEMAHRMERVQGNIRESKVLEFIVKAYFFPSPSRIFTCHINTVTQIAQCPENTRKHRVWRANVNNDSFSKHCSVLCIRNILGMYRMIRLRE